MTLFVDALNRAARHPSGSAVVKAAAPRLGKAVRACGARRRFRLRA